MNWNCTTVNNFISVSVVVCMLAQGIANGQDLLPVIPPSPNVSAHGKYTEVPVSLYTGVPDISVPLYQISNGDLTLPVSLRYHAGGIKVEEIASAVGLGWSLNAGGIIGRSVRGQPDEVHYWFPQPPSNTIEAIKARGDWTELQMTADDVYNGTRDGEADIFYFNFGSYSGKFFFDQNGDAHTIPKKNFIIKPIAGGWSIATEDGVVYSFAKVEEVTSESCLDTPPTHTAWFLTKISSRDGNREINFEYEPAYYTYTTLGQQIKYLRWEMDAWCIQNEQPCLASHYYRTQRLTGIDFEIGRINFKYNNIRCDLVDDKSLDEIEIYDYTGTLVRRFQLYHSYFGSNPLCDRPNEIYTRLKLDSVVESSATERMLPYEFSYNEEIPLPSRLSYGQDHWGYYNGRINNSDLVPSVAYVNINGHQVFESGADRKVNTLTSQAGVLTRIVYPTGGETLFTYENNETNDFRADPETVEEDLFLFANSPMPEVYESQDVLVVPANGAMVTYYVQGEDCVKASEVFCEGDGWDCRVYVYKDDNPMPFRTIDTDLHGHKEMWPEGTYRLKALEHCDLEKSRSFSVTISATIILTPPDGRKSVGGLRVAKIEQRSQIGEPMIKTYEYNDKLNASKSSGMLVNFPTYVQDHLYLVRQIERDEFDRIIFSDECIYKPLTSYSNYPLATTSGSYIGYEHVIEKYGENGENGERRYEFLAYPDLDVPTFPYPPRENFDWRRGSLLRVKEFGRNGQQLFPVKEIINTYQAANEVRIYGMKTAKDERVIDLPVFSRTPARWAFYETMAEFYELSSTTEKIYDPNDESKFTERIITYTYNHDHLQVTQIKTSTSRSDGVVKEEVLENRKYAYDYEITGEAVGDDAGGIKTLQDLHVVDAVIEEFVVKQNINSDNIITNQYVVSGKVTTFKPDNPYPAELYLLDITSPISAEEFGNGSYMDNDSFVKDGHYRKRLSFLQYDDKGNIISQGKADDVPHSYLWGYNNSFPIAEVVNALPNVPGAPTNFFYTSFEEDEVDVSPDAYTGNKSHVGAYSIGGPHVPGTYIISYWTKSGIDPWRYHEGIVNVSPSSSASIVIGNTGTLIDEIRLYPKDGEMTTYTYDPLIGVTSMTDANNMTRYYVYDDFGRLKLIKDHAGNILKTYNYNHQVR